MKTRTKPLPVPDVTSYRYSSVDILGKGVHHYKAPYYAVMGALLGVCAEISRIDEDSSTSPLLRDIEKLPSYGALIGAFWHHLNLSLETEFPLNDLGLNSLLAYGAKVSEELQDAGYQLPDIHDLYAFAVLQVVEHIDINKMVEARLAFSKAPQESSTTG